MRSQTLVIVAAFTSVISGPATAVPPDNPYGGGTRITAPPPAEIPVGSMSPQDKARIVTQRLAACLIKEHRGAALKAIQPEQWQPHAGQMLVDVVDNRCLDRGELAIPPNLLRGALYQQFYRERFLSAPPVLPPQPIDFTADANANLNEEAKTDIALIQFGDCVARRDISDAHALVLATPGSAQESSAVSNLLPHFSACLVQGSKWTLNRSSASAVLSEVLYREGVAGMGKSN
jgi:hypothetical protein